VDYTNVSGDGAQIKLFGGAISNIVYNNLGIVEFTIDGSFTKNTYLSMETYSSLCRADLGDYRCKVNIEILKKYFEVKTVSSASRFRTTDLSDPDNYWQYGILQFTSGLNNGVALEIANSVSSTKEIVLFLNAPFDIRAGDQGIIYPGCDKTTTMCRARYSNLNNFRGEPYTVKAVPDI
jgi:uncharacterized phage protein (TIGR02218 family)